MTAPEAFDRTRGPMRRPPSDERASCDPRSAARDRRLARQRRTRTIRKRVAVGTLTLFLAAWSAIFVQMVSGHDPALARKANGTTSATSTSTSTSSTATAAGESGRDESAGETGESVGSGALTTGQS